MLKVGVVVETRETLPTPNFVKMLKGYSPLGKMYTKNYQFLRFWGLQAHILKATAVKFNVRMQTWETLPCAKFCIKIG